MKQKLRENKVCPRDTALSMDVRLRGGGGKVCVPDSTQGTGLRHPAPPSRSNQGTVREFRTQSSFPADIEVCCSAHVFLLFTHQCAAGSFRTLSSTAHPRVCRQAAHTVLSKPRQPDPLYSWGLLRVERMEPVETCLCAPTS